VFEQPDEVRCAIQTLSHIRSQGDHMNTNEKDENFPGHKRDDTQAEENTARANDSEPGTRAGGPVITKGPSQKEPESSE